MKPIKLTMDNFISYKHEEVDFEKLGQRLYLISGKTGAGKTTIFDGLMYALYGEVSGDSRNESMLHSDFAGLQDDTIVTLEFVENDQRYKVTRTIHFSKNRDNSGFKQGTSRAELTGESIKPVEGKEKVTERIIELLHMNADQFQQIVMLAQGKFRRFLDAKSDERMEILRTLFNTGDYARFQDILSIAGKNLNKELNTITAQLATIMEKTFIMPDGLSDEDRAGYRADHALLKEHLTTLLTAETEEQGKLQQTVTQADEAKTQAAKKLEVAEIHNKALETLDRAYKMRDQLAARVSEMEALRQTYTSA